MVDEHTLELTLTQNQVCLIDGNDMALVGEYQWYAHKSSRNKRNNYYVQCTLPTVDGKQKTLLLHRVIMGITDPKVQVDHVDMNSLNNCRLNLRVATHSENRCNQIAYSNSKTGIKDIYWHKRENKYRVQIKINGKQKQYGSFNTIQEAVVRRDELLPLLHKEFANTKDKGY